MKRRLVQAYLRYRAPIINYLVRQKSTPWERGIAPSKTSGDHWSDGAGAESMGFEKGTKSMTVTELRAALKGKPGKSEVVIWLPNSTIRIGPVMSFLRASDKAVMIEGNVNPGSALSNE